MLSRAKSKKSILIIVGAHIMILESMPLGGQEGWREV